MNGIKEDFESGSLRPDAGDYFIVSCANSTWYISTEMARFIEACLDGEREDGWVCFVDLAGSRIRLRHRHIEYLCQCTAEQRALDRRFSRALTRERKADRDWSEED